MDSILQKLKIADLLNTTLKPNRIATDNGTGIVILYYERYNNNLSISFLSNSILVENIRLGSKEEIDYNSDNWIDYLHEVLNDFIFDED